MPIFLEAAQTIIDSALAYAKENTLKPLGIGVLDARGALVAYAGQDGSSLGRSDIALAKAKGALRMGMGSRGLMAVAEARPAFVSALSDVFGGAILPVPGGVLIREDGAIIGAVGVSGDTSDNDEAAAKAGIFAAGFTADGG